MFNATVSKQSIYYWLNNNRDNGSMDYFIPYLAVIYRSTIY